jgi:hypothetical protein
MLCNYLLILNSRLHEFGCPVVVFLFGTKSFYFISKISVFFIFRILHFGLLVDHTHTQRRLYFSIGIRAGSLVLGLIS